VWLVSLPARAAARTNLASYDSSSQQSLGSTDDSPERQRMGSMAGVFVFDHDCFVNCVAPAFRDLLATSRPGPWLEQVWRTGRWWRSPRKHPFSLPLPSDPNSGDEYLNGDLSISATLTACCIPGGRGRNRDMTGRFEPLWHLFETALQQYCLGDWQYMGNATRPITCINWLPEGSYPSPGLQRLLTDLGERGAFWRHSGGGFWEGVHGWLSPGETAELVTELSRLPLPQYEPSWERMRAFLSEPVYQRPGPSRAELFLSFVRTVGVLAVQQCCGILWGNDVYPLKDEPNRPPPLEPACRTWRDGLVLRLARSIRDNSQYADLPKLADALKDAGCEEPTILAHCREPGEHIWSCWVTNLLLEDG
jgi:hypothetical protein